MYFVVDFAVTAPYQLHGTSNGDINPYGISDGSNWCCCSVRDWLPFLWCGSGGVATPLRPCQRERFRNVHLALILKGLTSF